MNGTSSLFFVFPHLVHLNSAQAEEHRTEARPNDIFRSAVSLNHPYTIPLFYDIQPFGTPTPPAIAAGYSNALKGWQSSVYEPMIPMILSSVLSIACIKCNVHKQIRRELQQRLD